MILAEFPVITRFLKDIKIIVAFLIIACLTSCATQKKFEYIQDKNENLKAFSEAEFPDYRLKPNDELYIQVSSFDEAAANVFSNAGNQTLNSTGGLSPYSASFLSYPIDKEGYLLLPVIGNISVNGKTLSQVSLIMRDSLKHVLNQPVVSVKLVNRYVTVLGEVKAPGHFPFSQEKLTVYDAIGLAGDITDYGNSGKVVLVRNENGENIRVNLDLTRSEMLASEFYYLRPNDIVYVRPLHNKVWRVREIPLTLLLSAITTGLLIYEIINSN
jgi:polysaccharide biosynthesis/export protein